MSFSRRDSQKAAAISDGNDTFKGGLSKEITYENIGTRLRGFYLFSSAALMSVISGHVSQSFHDMANDQWKEKMDRVENNRKQDGSES
ncbi:hypothetical protein ID10_07245 [Pantoea agglomerans]|jgi:hypothetical protein|uniref:hypothetical protein n=1 Tax=Enterobacter agglomerans TaxID=549 RepID=UPI00050EF792|nr:hypothetical protein [Pantoea agglomerans]KGD80807.1 hypothetical protein ID10_07245 [Pantoea agglomerans]